MIQPENTENGSGLVPRVKLMIQLSLKFFVLTALPLPTFLRIRKTNSSHGFNVHGKLQVWTGSRAEQSV